MRFAIVFLLILVISGCTRQVERAATKTSADQQAFVASVLAIGKARLLSQPTASATANGSSPAASLERTIDSLTSYGLHKSGQVSDSFLSSLNPELPTVYREKLITGARIWLKGMRKSRTEGGIAGVEEEAIASHLDSEWVAWLDGHQEISRIVIP